METHEKKFVIRRKAGLLGTINCTEIVLAELEKHDILSSEDIELIKSCRTRTAKAAKLLEILPTRRNSYQIFTMVLRNQKQSGAVKILKQLKQKNEPRSCYQHRKNLFFGLPEAFKKTRRHLILVTEDTNLSRQRFEEYSGTDNIEFHTIENLERECEMTGIEYPVETREGYYSTFRQKLLVIVPVNTKYKITIETDPSWEVIKERFEWDHFSNHGQQTLLDKKVQFHGHIFSLREMCDITEKLDPQLESTFMKCLESSLITKLLDNKIEVTKIADVNSPNVPAHYRHRKLRSRSRISRTVLNVTKNDDGNDGDIFVFICRKLRLYVLSSFVERFGDGNCDTSVGQLEHRHPRVKCILLDNPVSEETTDFDEICKKAHPRPVHLLECVLENEDTGSIKELHWIKSKGCIKTLQKYIHRLQNDFPENRLYSIDKTFCNPVIISDAPGMGKSSLLSKCASQLGKLSEGRNELVIVQFIILRDFLKKLYQSNPFLRPTMDENFLEACTKCLVTLGSTYRIGQLFLKSLLKAKSADIEGLSGKLKIEIMFDGIDELDSQNLKMAKLIVKGFSGYVNVHAWITSRPHLLESLEHYFDVLGIKINQYDEDDQVNFLSNYWHREDSNICQQMYEIARTTLQKLKEALSGAESSKDVAGTPLLCFLLAEIFKKEAHECHKQDLSHAVKRRITDLRITNLYEMYIEKTLTNCDTDDTTSVFLQHVEVAIHILFPELQLPFILDEWETGNVEKLLRYGIMEATEPCRFVHVTFAQYMVARGIIHILKYMSNHNTTNMTLGPTNNRFQKYTTLIKQALSVEMVPLQFSKFGKGSIKHQAHFKFANICFFFNHSLDFDIDVENIIDKIENNYNHDNSCLANNIWVSLLAAVTSNHFQIAKLLIRALRFVNSDEEGVKQFFSKYPQNDISYLIYLAAKYSTEDLFALVCSLCLDWNKETVQISDYVFECNLNISNNHIDFVTPLHVSVEAGNYKVTIYLLLKVGFVDIVNSDLVKYRFLLHFLLKNSIEDTKVTIQRKTEILEFLCHCVPDLFIKNIADPDVILERINLDLLLCFLKYRGKVQYNNCCYQSDLATNKYGENMLHLLATGHYDTDMTPEKYHNALLEISKVKPNLNIVSYLKAPNLGGWRAADVACSFIDLLDETLDIFQSLGIFINDEGRQQSTTIFKAVAGQRDAVVLEKLITRNIGWNPKAFGVTILHVAASYLNYSAVNLFVNKMNQEVNEQDDEGNTPLHVCFRVELQTLTGNKEVSSRDNKNENEAHCQPPILYSDLMQRSCDNTSKFSYMGQNIPCNKEVQTNIEREPSNQHKIISLLIEKGAAIDIKNNNNITPLNLALQISLGGLDEVEKGKLVSSRYSLFSSKEYMTMALKGLLLNNQIGYLWHPSLIASFADQLKSRQGDVLFEDTIDGSSLVHLAARNHSLFGVKYLVEKEGLNPNKKDRFGKTPLLSMTCSDNCNTFNCAELRRYLMDLVNTP